ncbi:hypothetical protein E2C01_061844 [Portunus trituberculatus]|uniref:Uncharacterized protein n=1 Tax=Portunus trituberculatus TaxID=210409 RepID=A0A5B7HDI6_PORTR|nr:hypothetical protein [Portunus trituberculatus]
MTPASTASHVHLNSTPTHIDSNSTINSLILSVIKPTGAGQLTAHLNAAAILYTSDDDDRPDRQLFNGPTERMSFFFH